MSLRIDAAITADAVALRHRLHRDPEVGLQLPRTAEAVREALAPLGLEIHRSARSSSFAAVLRGGEGPAVLLRADMDALPVKETTGLPYASTNDAMHACGHDLHTAALVGTAHALAARRQDLAGDVVLLFQAGEEGADGARILLEDGLLDAPGTNRCVAAFALHVLSDLDTGIVRSRPGAVTGYGTSVHAVFTGAGGHGATPHLTRDPIPALIAALGEIPVALSRGIDPHEAVVFTPGVVQAGVRRNIIPDSARFEATLRTFDPLVREQAEAIVRRVAHGAAEAHGVAAELQITAGYPAVIVDDAEHAFATEIARRVRGADAVVRALHPAAMTEDFSRIAQRIPSAFAFLGARPSGLAVASSNHSASALFDDDAIAIAIAIETAWALARLRSAAGHPIDVEETS